MEGTFKTMDIRITHLSPYPRRFSLLPPLESIGFHPRKTERVVHAFQNCNFSFILAGRGTYVLRGVEHPVVAPCVLLQWPGEPMDYGAVAGGAWTELFLIYPARCLAALRRAGVFAPGEPPVRPVAVDLAEAVAHLEDRLKAKHLDADRVDAACWELIVSSFAPGSPREGRLHAVERCREHLRGTLGGAFDAAALAKSLGMSLASLRRRWAEEHGPQTFSGYRDMILMQRSCRLLVETQATVKEIAARLGFADPYYFSRRFRQLARCTPTAYRRAHGNRALGKMAEGEGFEPPERLHARLISSQVH